MQCVRRFLFVVIVISTGSESVLAQATVSEHLTMGNPSNAGKDPAQADNFLMIKSQYVLSYSKSKATPNWVSWHLSTDWLGPVDRSNDFRADEELPLGWFRVTQSSFARSGFDRGHMCPSGDRTSNPADNSATFLMTNMVPQAPRNNQQTWKHLEDYSRQLAKKGNELYIIAGPLGVGGAGKNGPKSQVVDKKTGERITVPNSTWKVIMVLPKKDGSDVARVTKRTRLIAVIMPNSQTIDTDWTEYRLSVDEVEEQTGFNFFAEVPDDIEEEIESIADDEEVD